MANKQLKKLQSFLKLAQNGNSLQQSALLVKVLNNGLRV
jgi:hypothetical protein